MAQAAAAKNSWIKRRREKSDTFMLNDLVN
jgi:hypothetical protein